jgi:hypothetical protein
MVGIARIGRPPKSGALRKAEHDQRRRTLIRAVCADAKRRADLEAQPEKWLQYYFPGLFYLPFADSHRDIIKAVVDSSDNAMNVVVAAPRGEGKTAILRAMALFLLVTGRCRFPVLGGWTGKAAKIGWRQWKIWLTSKRFAEDYPEFAQPFVESTNATRLGSLVWNDTGLETGADMLAVDLVIVLPDGRGCLAAGSLNGDIKGLNIPLKNGETIRPDMILLDDPQDVARAADPAFVAEVVEKIESQWMCLSGPDSGIRMMAAVTIKEPDDVGETLGKDPANIFIRISRVTDFPEGFTDKNSKCRDLWDQWYSLFSDTRSRAESFEFYAKNKAVMTKGMKVVWEHRRDKKRKDPDAMFSAIADFYKVGETAFWSEYQNRPMKSETKVYSLTPAVVISRTIPKKVYEMPEGTALRVCATDLNPSYGLSSSLIGFDPKRRGHVAWANVFTDDPLPIKNTMSVDMRCALLSQALFNLGAIVSGMKTPPEHWCIDASGEYFDIVLDFAKTFKGVHTVAICGRDGKQFNPNVKSRIGSPRNGVYECYDRGKGKWLCFDADVYKETAQRAFLSDPGAIGACTLYDGNNREFSVQMCRKSLAAKVEVAGRMHYEWVTQPGKHDFLDVMAMGYALAGWNGLGAFGESAKQGRTRKKYSSTDMKARF